MSLHDLNDHFKLKWFICILQMKKDVSIGLERVKTGRQLSQTNLCASIDKRKEESWTKDEKAHKN